MNSAAMISLAIGIVLLILGRKLFWLFVGVAGFLIGMNIAEQASSGPQSTKLLIALIAGVIGAVLAIFLRKVAIAVAGFVLGGYVALELLRVYGGGSMPAYAGAHIGAFSIPYIIGGIIGAILVVALFDWALIILSSLSGALMIVGSIPMQQSVSAIVFIVLVFIGIVIQAGLMRSARSHGV